jgi:glucokinase
MASVPIVIAVDVGGTTISAGAVSSAGEVLMARQVATHDAPGRAGATLEALIEEIRRAATASGYEVRGIGVGVPGPVDTATGRISEHVPHVPELAGRALAGALTARFRLPAFVDNDVNALALGEWMFGAGRAASSLVVLAAGTGFGTGIVIDGRLLRGAHGFGGELGHAPVKFDGPPCWCGGRGCLALYASGRGIADAARARVAGDPGAALLRAAGGDVAAITAPLVFRLADEGDPAAAAVVDEACQALGAMIGVVVNGIDPEVIVITGGVAAAFLPLEKRVLRAAADYAFAAALARTRVSIALADKGTTMRGAAALALHEMERKGTS